MPDDRDPMCIPVRLHSVRENARVTLVHAAPGAGAAPPAARFSLSADFPILYASSEEIHAKFRSRSQRYGTVGTNLISVLRTALTEYLIRSAPYHPQAANTRGARGCLARSGVLGLHDRTEVRRLDADRPPGFVNTSSSSSTSSSITVLDIRIASRCARGVRRELSRREQMLFTPSSTRRRQEVCAKSASW